MARQNLWRWCKKCEGLFYSGSPDQGACPAGGKHDGSGSGYYDVVFGDDIPEAQNFWRWCDKCQGAFYSGNPDQGACPAGGKHDGSQSAHYSIMFGDNVPATQGGWRWCYKCQGLFYSGSPDQGACPAGGKHDGSQSAQYGVCWEFPSLNQIVLSRNFGFPPLVAVSAFAILTLSPDGSYNFNVNFHDSGALDYHVSVLWVLRSSIGQVFTFGGSGHICGTDPFCTDPRDWPYPVQPILGQRQEIADAWDDLSAYYSGQSDAQVNVDVGTLWNGIKSSIGAIQSVVSVVGPILLAL